MTKKSVGRLERDLVDSKNKNAKKMRDDYFKKNTGWDDANDLYQAAALMVVGTGETIRQGYSDKTVFDHFNQQEKVEVNTSINGMNKDLQQFTTELLVLQDLHKDRSGAVKTDDDFTKIIEIGQAYSDFTARFSAVVSPNQKFLTDKLGVALTRREEIKSTEPVNVEEK